MNLHEFDLERIRLSRLVDEAVDQLINQTMAYATKENAYRKAKSVAFQKCPPGTVPERTAWVQAETADLRYERDIAEGLKWAAREAIAARMAQLSAIQTLLNAEREEMRLDRTAA